MIYIGKKLLLFFITIIIICCNPSLVLAQEQTLSKRQLFLKSDSLFKIGNEFYQKKQIDSSIIAWSQALEGFESLQEKKAALAVMNNLAMAYKQLNESEKYQLLLEKQIVLSQSIQDKKNMAIASFSLAMYWIDRLKFEKADSIIESALNFMQSFGDKKDLASIYIQAANVKQRQSKLLPALEYFQLAEKFYVELNDSLGIGNAALGSGLVLLQLGEYQQAKNKLEESILLKEQYQDQRGIAKGFTNLGVVYDRLGKTDLAESYYHKAYAICESLKLKDGMIDNLINMGVLHHNRGHYQKALETYRQALQWIDSGKFNEALGQVLTNLGLIYRDMNDLDSALIYLNQAVAIERKNKDWRGLASDLSIIGNIFWRKSDYYKACNSVEEAISIRQAIGDKHGLSNDLIYLGIILSSIAESEALEHPHSSQMIKADTILSLFQKAYSIKKEVGDYDGEVTVLTYIGQTYRILKQYNQAIFYLKQADSMAKAKQMMTLQWQITYALAKTYEKEKNYMAARNEYNAALSLIESQRALITTKDFRMGFLKDKSFIYSEAVELFYSQQLYKEAFEVAERSRSRTFLDMLGTKFMKGANQSTLLRQLDSIESSISELSSLNDGQLQRETINDLIDKKNQLIRQIDEDNQETTSLITVMPFSVDSLQLLLPSDITILEYYTTPRSIYIFVVDRLTVHCVKTDIANSKLVSLILNFRQELQNPKSQKYKSFGKALYQLLIKPVIAYLKTDRLVIVPHERMHYIPFSSLISEDEQFLIDRFTLTTLTSANLIRFVIFKRKESAKEVQLKDISLLALGNPAVAQYPRLKEAEYEVQSIGELFIYKNIFIGERATKKAFLQHAKNSEIIHFACHGVFNIDEPMKSALLLSDEPMHNGSLTVQEIFNYPLPKAQLVVLSACETGLAKLIKGDELIGFIRAFIYAGSPSIISSLWQVSDESTAKLMISLYRNMDMLDKPGSLRKAQLELKSTKGYEHPFFWSAFQINGDWK